MMRDRINDGAKGGRDQRKAADQAAVCSGNDQARKMPSNITE